MAFSGAAFHVSLFQGAANNHLRSNPELKEMSRCGKIGPVFWLYMDRILKQDFISPLAAFPILTNVNAMPANKPFGLSVLGML